MVLTEKNIPHEHIEVDLRNKPADFLAVSRYGKVPCVVDGSTVVYESAIINEYLDEQYPQPRLMPATPGERAQVRIWVDFCNQQVFPAALAMLRGPDREGAREKLLGQLRTLEKELQGKEHLVGTYSLADIAFVPLLTYVGTEVFPLAGEFPHLRAWRARLLARPAVQACPLGRPS